MANKKYFVLSLLISNRKDNKHNFSEKKVVKEIAFVVQQTKIFIKMKLEVPQS
jgi:hypothetical protein